MTPVLAPSRTGRTWTLELAGDRPLTVNEARRLHHYQWGTQVKAIRRDWRLLALAEQVPPLARAVVTVTPLHRDRRSPQDVAACAPHAKAAIDGLIDARVLPDDDATHLALVTFTPADICGHNGIRIHIEELHP